MGIPFDGMPGPLNALTDVPGVAVGHVTLVSGKGRCKPGHGPVRTGVTAILPRGRDGGRVFAAFFCLNGNGELTGAHWIRESGFLEGPVMLTNTHSVGTVRDAVIAWLVKNNALRQPWVLPVVAETWDGYLNDINGFHVRAAHAFTALEKARPGPVDEGSVGGGTGMVCHEFKGGIGTASRRIDLSGTVFTLGVLVQANHGQRHLLRVAGIPVGRLIRENTLEKSADGSIVIIIATDAPLLPHQLKALALRASLGLGRTGSIAAHTSGDLFLAFSTAAIDESPTENFMNLRMIDNRHLSLFFEACVQAVEEAIINALVAAETMTGRDDRRVIALPRERTCRILKDHHRLSTP
jgi:L-aminopeptidase/D-esterase-like protein